MILQPVTREFLCGLRGSLNGKPSALAALLEKQVATCSPRSAALLTDLV
jgi:hypothetical protein